MRHPGWVAEFFGTSCNSVPVGFTTYTDLAVAIENFPPWENQPLPVGFTTYTDLAVAIENFPPWENQPLPVGFTTYTDLAVAVENLPLGEASLPRGGAHAGALLRDQNGV